MRTDFFTRLLPGLASIALCAAASGASVAAEECDPQGEYTQEFRRSDCSFVNEGRTPFFVLEPGYWLQLEGLEKDVLVQVTITVLRDTEFVDGVRTRVVEERELKDGEIVEVSRNFFAICAQTGSVFYFGEDVDIYENGVIVSHGGAWRAGVAGARPGIIMPGTFLLGSRYFQEIAPDAALDRACNAKMNLTENTPAGIFSGCVEVRETSPLEPGHKSIKAYCPGVGLVRGSSIRLADWSDRR